MDPPVVATPAAPSSQAAGVVNFISYTQVSVSRTSMSLFSTPCASHSNEREQSSTGCQQAAEDICSLTPAADGHSTIRDSSCRTHAADKYRRRPLWPIPARLPTCEFKAVPVRRLCVLFPVPKARVVLLHRVERLQLVPGKAFAPWAAQRYRTPALEAIGGAAQRYRMPALEAIGGAAQR